MTTLFNIVGREINRGYYYGRRAVFLYDRYTTFPKVEPAEI